MLAAGHGEARKQLGDWQQPNNVDRDKSLWRGLLVWTLKVRMRQ